MLRTQREATDCNVRRQRMMRQFAINEIRVADKEQKRQRTEKLTSLNSGKFVRKRITGYCYVHKFPLLDIDEKTSQMAGKAKAFCRKKMFKLIIDHVAPFLDFTELLRVQMAGMKFVIPIEVVRRELGGLGIDLPAGMDAQKAKTGCIRMKRIQLLAEKWEARYRSETHPRTLPMIESIKDCCRFLFFFRLTVGGNTFQGTIPCARTYHSNFSSEGDAASIHGKIHWPVPADTVKHLDSQLFALVVVRFTKCYLFDYDEMTSLPPTLIYASELERQELSHGHNVGDCSFLFGFGKESVAYLSRRSEDLSGGPFATMFGSTYAEVHLCPEDGEVGISMVHDRDPSENERGLIGDDGPYNLHDHRVQSQFRTAV